MGLRSVWWVRSGTGVLLGASGALMYAASWQRWTAACPEGRSGNGDCELLQDHRYDFIAPSDPWVPVGGAAQLAGWSLLVLTVAFVLLPWALTGRRPGAFSAVTLVAVVLAQGAVGVAGLRSGLAGHVVTPALADVASLLWVFGPPVVLVRFAIGSRGWTVAAAALLILATPLVAAFSYAVGPYDAQPWWEAVSGVLTVLAGGCLLVAAARGTSYVPSAIASDPHDVLRLTRS